MSDLHAKNDPTSLHVRRAVRGDTTSESWLTERFTPLLFISARSRIRGKMRQFCSPEDLVQEVWTVTLPRLKNLKPREGRLTPVLVKYLSRVLLNIYCNMMKRYLRWQKIQAKVGGSIETEFVSQLPVHTRGAITRAMTKEAIGKLEESLDELGERDRRVVVLRGLEQIPNKEVAILLDEDADAVSARYNRALRKLREMLPGSVFHDFE